MQSTQTRTAPTLQTAIAAAAAYVLGQCGHIDGTKGKKLDNADPNAANGPNSLHVLPANTGRKNQTFYFTACIGQGGSSTEYAVLKARAGMAAQHPQHGGMVGCLVAFEYGWRVGNCAIANGAYWATNGAVYGTDSVGANPVIDTMPEPLGHADCLADVVALFAQHLATPQKVQAGRAQQRANFAAAKAAKAAPVADTAAPVADTAAPVADTAAPVADTAAPVAEQAADTAAPAAPAAPVADTAAPAAPAKGNKRTKQKQAA